MGGDNRAIMQPALPNITGYLGTTISNQVSGAFYEYSQVSPIGSGGWPAAIIRMDASRCSSIYASENTVRPPSLQLIPQIKY